MTPWFAHGTSEANQFANNINRVRKDFNVCLSDGQRVFANCLPMWKQHWSTIRGFVYTFRWGHKTFCLSDWQTIMYIILKSCFSNVSRIVTHYHPNTRTHVYEHTIDISSRYFLENLIRNFLFYCYVQPSSRISLFNTLNYSVVRLKKNLMSTNASIFYNFFPKP